MQNIQLALGNRIQQEWRDLNVEYPLWLERILDDDVDYTVALAILCACSFTLGLLIGWLLTI